MSPDPSTIPLAGRVLDEIRKLDPIKDHQRIVFLSTRYDFPFDTVRSLELALFRTFCVPSISVLLDRTGEFAQRSQKRYDDTDLIVSELMEYGYESERGKSALRRMNQIHSRFAISNDDFLYVLSTFIFEPIRWNERFGWRLMIQVERLALFQFWREVGKRMNIRDIPNDYNEFASWCHEYEAKQFRYTEANHRVGCATRDMFLSWFPRILHSLVRPAIYAMMDEPMRQAFGFPKASCFMRWLVPVLIRTRSRFVRLLPSRRRPFLRTELRHLTYPAGYTIEKLGPPNAK